MNKGVFVRFGFLWSIMAMFITLPMTIKINTFCVIISGCFWLISSSVQHKMKNLKVHSDFIFFTTAFFTLNIIGLLWTINFGTAFKIIEKNIVLLLIPIIILTGSPLSMLDIRKIKYGFVFSCLSFSLVNLIHATYRYSVTVDSQEFFYYQLSQTFDIHPVYLSIFYLFCIILIISFWVELSTKSRIWATLAVLFFGISILLLESKMILSISLLLVGYFVFILLRRRSKSVWLPSLTVLLILVFSGFALMKFNSRFKEISSFENLSIVSETQMTDFNKINGLTLRLMFWKFSLEEFNPQDMVLGLGTGDVQDFLDNTYEKHNMAISYDGKVLGYYNYDVHNQFLDIFLRFGLVGVILFMSFMTWLLIRFISHRMLVPISFILIIMLTFLTETFLGLNKGIVFFSLFSTIFSLERSIKSYH